MDIFYNSLTNFPESTNDYISNVIHTKLPNTYGFLAVIVVFFFIFSYFTKSNSINSPSFESNSNSMTLELILIVVFIILVVFNLVYLNTESLDISNESRKEHLSMLKKNTALNRVLDTEENL